MVADDATLRSRIFADVLAASDSGTVPLSRQWLLSYQVDGERLPLIDAQGRGIRNVDGWGHTLSITTSENGRYPDKPIGEGIWIYPLARQRSGKDDPSNKKLIRAYEEKKPVMYFYKPVPNVYLYVGLVEVSSIDGSAHTSVIELLTEGLPASVMMSPIERRWIERTVKARLHQPRFREVILEAYRDRCAVCGLPNRQLLDAAHIRGDKDPINGQPLVENGLALCAIHHRAYDARLLGIDEEYGLHVRQSVLDTVDGPVLDHALKRLPGTRMTVIPPKGKRPDPYRLSLTYKEFLAS